ncbi:MAG: tetraacyldisaccharide 4'-kinase [Planctomycetia bacterium]|nr:tetraacyldisaccharide 4'-kinase [Planctomycetia bacterium]
MAALARGALSVAEAPYSWAMRRRNRAYASGRRPSFAADVPVVSVGNLTLGGTGKTPLVEWIARWLRGHDIRVAIVSRGYGARTDAANDEALELEERLPDVPHVQNADRVAAVAVAVDELQCQMILLDDGFQHRRLRRDLDIVLLDALEPFGFEHVFPRGTLREPLDGLSRAQVVILSRADMLTAPEREAIRGRVLALAPGAAWAECAHRPGQFRAASGATASLESLRGKPVAAFCGIGNPAGFRHSLAGCGCNIVAWREFADHHAYERADLEELAKWADASEAAAVVCTHKDLVKLRVDRLGSRPLWALEVGLEFSRGEEAIAQALAPLVERARARE